jgi:hypothetical protein
VSIHFVTHHQILDGDVIPLVKIILKQFVIFTFLTFVGLQYGKKPMNLGSHLRFSSSVNSWDFMHKGVLWGISLGVGFLVIDYGTFMFWPSIHLPPKTILHSIGLAIYHALTHEILYRMFVFCFLLNVYQTWGIYFSTIYEFQKEHNLVFFISFLTAIIQVFVQFFVFGLSLSAYPVINIVRTVFYQLVMGVLFGYMYYTDEKIESVMLTRFYVAVLLYSYGNGI